MDLFNYSQDVHAFMKSNVPLDEAGRQKLHELATYVCPSDSFDLTDSNRNPNVDFCLQSAVTFAQVDKAIILIDEYGADFEMTHELARGNGSNGMITHNLLDQALRSFLYRPDVDHSPAGLERVSQMVEFLLQKGLSAGVNPHPLENSIRDAAVLANPRAAFDPSSPLCDWIVDDYNRPPFTKPYELIAQYEPRLVAAFEEACKNFKPEDFSDMEVSFTRATHGSKKQPNLIQKIAEVFGLRL